VDQGPNREFPLAGRLFGIHVSPSQLERVRTYIQRQAEHHRKRTFAEEYRDLLRAHGIDFDERFLL